MATAYRPSPDLMSANYPMPDYRERYAAYWQRLRASPHAYDLFGTLRWIDALGAPHARIGRAVHPREEPLRLGQAPSLSFAPTMVAQVAGGAAGTGALRLRVYGFGLFGPQGPMPLHLTEYAAAYDAGGNGLREFADLFHHRAIALFYRAWADAQPVVAHDRAVHGPFDRYAASLVGRASRVDAANAVAPSPSAMSFYAGHWVRHARNPEGLVKMLEAEFGVRVRLVEHVVRWLAIDEAQRTTLRTIRPAQRLGHGALLGRAVRDGQSCFRLVLGPMSLERYRTFLPNGDNARRVARWVREYVGAELDWVMQLELAAEQVPHNTLGSREGLGHCVWLGRRMDTVPADDLTIDRTGGSARARSDSRLTAGGDRSVAAQP